MRLWSKDTSLPSISPGESRCSCVAILPMDRRERLAELLTDDDVETLKHLARDGMGENGLLRRVDLAYLEAWADGAAANRCRGRRARRSR